MVHALAKVSPGVEDLTPAPASFRDLALGPAIALFWEPMRALLVLVPTLVACTSQNVVPLVEFGPMDALIMVELGPVSAESGRDVNDRVNVHFWHDDPNCPVFDDDIRATIDGVRPDSFEHGSYEEGSSYGHNDDPTCQSPYFSMRKVPSAKPLSVLRLSDTTADYSLEVDRLFVNPAMTLATPLVRGQVARIDVADDRLITKVEGEWWVEEGDEYNNSAMIYDVMATVTPNGISFRMPSEVSGVGRLDVRVELEAPQLTCNGFAKCTVTIKGSQTFDATLQ